MPVRSLHSSIFRWPDAQEVDQAVRHWATAAAGNHPEVFRIGYIGSYARGDWGVGSDVDILILVADSAEAFVNRPLAWDTTALPVPTDVQVYTQAEWAAMAAQKRRFYCAAMQEAVWVYERLPEADRKA